jgi:hypothetical protein
MISVDPRKSIRIYQSGFGGLEPRALHPAPLIDGPLGQAFIVQLLQLGPTLCDRQRFPQAKLSFNAERQRLESLKSPERSGRSVIEH